MIKRILKSTLFKNFSSLALIQIGNYLLPLLIVPYVSRVIGLDNFGKLEFARTLVVYFTIFIDYGFNLTVTREISINRNNKEELNRIVSETYVAKFILFIVATVALYILTVLFEDYNNMSFLLWVTFLINIGFFLFPLWFFQGIERLSKIAFINFFIKVLFFLSIFFVIKNKEDFWKYNFIISMVQIIIGIVSIYILRRTYNIQYTKVNFKRLIKKYKDGFNVFLSTILVSIFVTYAFILLKKYGTDSDLGAYSTAIKLAMIIQGLVILPFAQSFFPHISKLAVEDNSAYKKNLIGASLLMFTITFIIGIFSFIFAKEIILFIFGDKFVYAIPVFKVLAFLPIFSVMNNIFAYQGLLSLKKDKLFLYIHLIFAFLVIIISTYLVPYYGLTAVTYIRILSEALLMIATFFLFLFSLKNKY